MIYFEINAGELAADDPAKQPMDCCVQPVSLTQQKAMWKPC